jgi:hypothetical protein
MFFSTSIFPQKEQSEAKDPVRNDSNRSRLVTDDRTVSTSSSTSGGKFDFNAPNNCKMTVIDILMKLPPSVSDIPSHKQPENGSDRTGHGRRRRIIIPASVRTVRNVRNVRTVRTSGSVDVLRQDEILDALVPSLVAGILARASPCAPSEDTIRCQGRNIRADSPGSLVPASIDKQLPSFKPTLGQNCSVQNCSATKYSQELYSHSRSSQIQLGCQPHNRFRHNLQDSTTAMSSLEPYHQEGTPQQFDESLSPGRSLRRSRSIAINHTTSQQQEDYETSSQESEKMYDYATWRMYNRIVDHRRNQQPMQTGFPAALQVPMNLCQAYANTRTAQEAAAAPIDLLSQDYIHDEVFELEI